MLWPPLSAACSRSRSACCSLWRSASGLSQSVITVTRPLERSASPIAPTFPSSSRTFGSVSAFTLPTLSSILSADPSSVLTRAAFARSASPSKIITSCASTDVLRPRISSGKLRAMSSNACSELRIASSLSKNVIPSAVPRSRSKSPRKPFASGTVIGPWSRARRIRSSVRLGSRPSNLATRAYIRVSPSVGEGTSLRSSRGRIQDLAGTVLRLLRSGAGAEVEDRVVEDGLGIAWLDVDVAQRVELDTQWHVCGVVGLGSELVQGNAITAEHGLGDVLRELVACVRLDVDFRHAVVGQRPACLSGEVVDQHVNVE